MDKGHGQLAVRSPLLVLNLASFKRPGLRRRLKQTALRQTPESLPTATLTMMQPPCCTGRLRLLHLLVKSLRFMGFQFTTLSKALHATSGRFACLTIDGSAGCIHTDIYPKLAALGVPATLFIPTDEIAREMMESANNASPENAPLSWHHIRHLRTQGWEIGAAGHESTNLTELGSEEQRQQVAQARSILSRRLGEAPRLFSYPFGAYDATTVSCVRDEGFEAAVTSKKGVNSPGDSFNFHLKRLSISAGRWRDLWHVIRGAWQAVRTHPPEASVSLSPQGNVARIRSRSML